MKKRAKGCRWSSTAKEILRHTSLLAVAIREAQLGDLEMARARLKEFRDAWLRTGEGDVLPVSGKNDAAADLEGTLSDTDIVEAVLDVLKDKMEELEIDRAEEA